MGRHFEKLDRSCPAQRADEAQVDYLRRLSRIGRRYIPAGEEIARVKFDDTLPDEVVPKFSELMRAAVERNLYRTDNMQPWRDAGCAGGRSADRREAASLGWSHIALYATRCTGIATAGA